MKPWQTPLDVDKQKTPHGKIHIIVDRCKGCGFCVEYCPRDVLEMSDEYNQKGYHPAFAAHEEKCINCDLCELICPEFAIFVLKDDDESEDKLKGHVDTVLDDSDEEPSDEKSS
ncbi:4Fe-4S binding protein [bacterium]|nr:4Fe-4S binding protein [bacterium]